MAVPSIPEKLIARGHAAYEWAKQTVGWLGKSPDYAASMLVRIMTHIELFDAYSQERADAFRKYSSVASPVERIRMMRLVWDAVGSEFASRHQQYELFYTGAPYQTLARLYHQYNWQASKELVEKIRVLQV
ncbi:4-hydroxyphenylacetate 3-hydroxylase C-terminal domain-containing protein [Xenorhabdus szentirmaii]|nr:4-hydroxyphenylacetate 3-hydroxylase C-terminal domain-containing protein [Xenorhabdus sp. CUL]